MTVELLKDLLSSAMAPIDAPAKFYFGHSETLLPLLARLGVARDQVRGWRRGGRESWLCFSHRSLCRTCRGTASGEHPL